MKRILHLASLIVASFTMVGCDRIDGESEWRVFSNKFFSGTRAKDEKTLLDLSWVDKEFLKENTDDPKVDIDKAIMEMKQEHMVDIPIYLNSYEDLFPCEPAVMTRYPHEFSQVPHLKGLDTMIVVIWVKKNGKYHGIHIPCVVKTSKGRKVMDWLGLGGYEASRKHQLKKHRIKLVADSLEACKLEEFNEWENVYESN